MRSVTKHYILLVLPVLTSLLTITHTAQTEGDYALIKAEFEGRAKNYAELRERLEAGLPVVAADATPEQIDAHRRALAKAIREARKGAKQGDLLMPETAMAISGIIVREIKDQAALADLRKAVVEAENDGVPVKVNAEYPASEELLEMPPKLLLALPELPEILRYRFVGKNMLIVDRESGLIIDFAADVIP